MIYEYDMERYIALHLMSELPSDSFVSTRNLNKLQNTVVEDDLVIFANYKAYKAYDRICEKTSRVFPSKECDALLRNRAVQLRELDKVTRFALRRSYVDSHKGPLPRHPEGMPVIKYGINHQGDAKFKGNPNRSIVLYGDNIVFEEFVPNARGIRVFMVDDDLENSFIIEQVNPNCWIKNIDPVETVTWHYSERHDTGISNIDDIIADAMELKRFVNHDMLAMDYAVSDERTGFLEANHIPGTPDDSLLNGKVKAFYVKLCRDYLNERVLKALSSKS